MAKTKDGREVTVQEFTDNAKTPEWLTLAKQVWASRRRILVGNYDKAMFWRDQARRTVQRIRNSGDIVINRQTLAQSTIFQVLRAQAGGLSGVDTDERGFNHD